MKSIYIATELAAGGEYILGVFTSLTDAIAKATEHRGSSSYDGGKMLVTECRLNADTGEFELQNVNLFNA